MDENTSGIEFGIEPELVFEEKALGGKIGPKIGGGLRKPPPGMVFVDITGAVDGDGDGIVFDNTPFQRPIIPRAAITMDEARKRESSALSGALENEKRRNLGRENVPVGSASRSGDGRKKRGKQRKLTDEELRIQQEQKLRARTIPKKRKPGPDAGEWQDGSRSTTSRVSPDPDVSPTVTRLVDDYLDMYPPVGSKSRTDRGRGGKTFPKKSKEEKLDALTKFLADSLIAALEESKDGKWKRPWKSIGLYRNGTTGKPYKGSNQAILAMVAEHKGYSKPIWLTYKQAQELGGQVRKGEKGTMLSYWRRSTYAVAGPDGEIEEKDRWMSTFFTVFNIDQIDGIDPSRFPEPEVLAEENRIETIQQIVEELGVRWAEGGDRAYNSPMDDRIQMPPFGAFESPEAFYATLMHEIVHWTGNPGRLDRPKMNTFGSPEYAYEELIAEIGSSMLMAVLGLESRPDEQHVQYIKSWLQKLKDDPGQVSQAAAAAQKAVDWLVDKSPTLKNVFDAYYPPIADVSDDDEDGGIDAPGIGDVLPEGDVTPQESTNSWDYDSYGIPGSKSSTRPQFPRKPPAPAFSGRAADLIRDVRSWDEFWDQMGDEEIVFIDYETTGLVFDDFNEPSSNGLPTQLGAVRMRNGKVIDRFNVYINPGLPYSEWEQWSRDNLKDENGNPVTQEFLEDKPSISEAHQMFVDWAGSGVILGMQNAVFDNEVLETALAESGIDWRPDGILDTKEIADATLPKWSPDNQDAPFRIDGKTGEKKPSNGLADITKYLGVSLGEKHHTADFDAAATGEVLTRIVEGAIEKGWPTDALDPEKRAAKEKAKQDKFSADIAEFRKAKDAWLADQQRDDQADVDGISLEIDTPGSKSTTRRWGSALSNESLTSPQRRGTTHVDVARLAEGDTLPDNWDAPNRPLGEPRWVVRSVRPNIDGTLSVTLGDVLADGDIVDVIFEKGSLVPNVSRPLRANVPLVSNEREAETTRPIQPRWISPEVVYRRNASAEATEFALFDDGLPARVSPFEQQLFERGPMRSNETSKLNRLVSRYTIEEVEDSMRFIVNKARRNSNFDRIAAEKELVQLRNNIAYNGLIENLDADTIADLLEGTYTGESYKDLNNIMRRRGQVSSQTRTPIGYPSSIAGSKSSTRLDSRPELPTGSLVRISGPTASEGGFWRADFEESMVKDISEDVAINPTVVRNKILSGRIAPMSVASLTDIAHQSDSRSPGSPMSRERWLGDISRILQTVTAHELGNGDILLIARDGTEQLILSPNSDGVYPDFATRQIFQKNVLRPIQEMGKPSVTDNLSKVPSRYRSNIEKASRLFPGNIFAFNNESSMGHRRLWLLDEFGLPVSHRAAGMSSSPGRDDAIYIANYILDRLVQDKFETIRGKLSANTDYLYAIAPYIGMPGTGPGSDGRLWRKAPSIDASLDEQLVWQIDIPLDENRNPALGEAIRTNLQIDIYQIPQSDGSTIFRVVGQAINGPTAEIYEISVDFPTRESAVAYALSEASPYPHHAWATNIDSARRRLPDGLQEKYVIDDGLRKILAGDRVLSSVVGISGSKSTTGQRIYFDSNGIAEQMLLDTSGPVADERFNNFIEELSKVNDRSRALLRQLEDELAKAEPDDARVSELEKAMKVHDLITLAVADAILSAASRNRQWRLRKAATAVAKQMLINENRDGSSIFNEEEVRRIARSLDDDAASLFGGITSQSATDRISAALLALGSTGWPESFSQALDSDDELGPEDIERLINSPTDEILSVARNILDAEKRKVSSERNRKRRSLLEDLDSGDSVAGYRPLLLGNPIEGSASRTRNASYVNGRGLGDSRLIFPTADSRNKGGAVDYVYYDGSRQELIVQFAGSAGEYTYGGIPMGVADKLERSFGIGREINSIINNGQYSYLVKPNGDTEGEPIKLSQLIRDDIERLSKYSEFSETIAEEIEFLLDSFEKNPQRIANLEPAYFDNMSYRLWATAANLSQVSGEHAASDHLLDLINLIDDFRSSGLAGRASRRNRMPLRDKTTLNLNSDELGEIRQEVRDILRANPDDNDMAVLARFEEQIRKAQEKNSPLVLSRDDHEKYSIAYDKLFAKANNKEIDARFGRTVAESLLNLSAFSGKYDSPRLDSNGGFRGRPFNSGAPSGYNPDELISWARRQRTFRVAQSLVSRYDSNGGFLTNQEWRRLGEYYDNSLRRPRGFSSSSKSTTSRNIQGSRSSTGPSDPIPDEPSTADLSAIEGEAPVGGKKKTKKVPGRSIQDVFGNRLDGLSPEEQIDAMFAVGVATPKNKDGINQEEFEARVRDLETQRLALEAMEQEQAMREAMADAVRRGVEFNEDEWYEGYATARENRRRQIIDRYMEMLLGDDIDKRGEAERFLGFTREEWMRRQEEQAQFRLLEIKSKQKNDARKTKTSYPIPELIKKLRRAAQVRSAALSGAMDGDEEQHSAVWDNIIRVLEEMESDIGASLTPDVVLDQIADMLQDYETSIFDVIDPDRSSGGPSPEARRSISAARQWRDVVRNSLDAAESEEDDEITDEDDGDEPLAGSKSTTARSLNDSGSLFSPGTYEYGSNSYLDSLVDDTRNWRYVEEFGQGRYVYTGYWPEEYSLTYPDKPPFAVRSRLNNMRLDASIRKLQNPAKNREAENKFGTVLFGDEQIPLYDKFPSLSDEFKTTVIDDLHMAAPSREPILDFPKFAIPGSDGARSVDTRGPDGRTRRYRRRRPYWRNGYQVSNSDLSKMTDSELQDMLRSLGYPLLEPIDFPERLPIRLIIDPEERRPQSRPNRIRQQYSVNDIIGELDRRGYYVYESDGDSTFPEWYVVAKADATPEEISRRMDGSWAKRKDETTLPNDRVEPDGDRDIDPVDYVINIIESENIEPNEKNFIDLIDNSDINDMSLDEVNGELLNIRDELEDLRRRTNNGEISRAEYNQRRRELNHRKQMLLQKKHGNKDAARKRTQNKPRGTASRPAVTINNSGDTNINVSGDGNTIINSGGQVSSTTSSRISRRTATTQVGTSGIKELRQIEQSRSAVRGEVGPISGSKSSTDGGRRFIDFYKMEFGMTGDDFEEIVHGIGSEETIKEKFGITDEDIRLIRANWRSALPVEDLARANGHDEIDVAFLARYDRALERIQGRIRELKESQDKRANQIIQTLQEKLKEDLEELKDASAREDYDDLVSSLKQQYADDISRQLKSLDIVVQSEIDSMMRAFKQTAAMEFMKTYVQAGRMPQADVPNFIRDLGLLDGGTSRHLMVLMSDLGMPDEMWSDIIKQLNDDIELIFRQGRDFEKVFDTYGGKSDSVLDALKRSVFEPDLLGATGSQLQKFFEDSEINDIDSPFDSAKINFPSFDEYMNRAILPSDPEQRLAISKAYIESLANAYRTLLDVVKNQPDLVEDGTPTPQLRDMYMNALRRSLFPHIENIHLYTLSALSWGSKPLAPGLGDNEFDDMADVEYDHMGEALWDMYEAHTYSDVMDVLSEVTGLDRDSIITEMAGDLDQKYGPADRDRSLDPNEVMEMLSSAQENARYEFTKDRLARFFSAGLSISEISKLTGYSEAVIMDMIRFNPMFQRYIDTYQRSGLPVFVRRGAYANMFRSLRKSGLTAEDVALRLRLDLGLVQDIFTILDES